MTAGCTYTYIHTYIHTYMYRRIHTYIHAQDHCFSIPEKHASYLIQYPNEFEYDSSSCEGAPSKTVPLNTECEASSDGMYVCMYDVCMFV
jgi:hypothetical protein